MKKLMKRVWFALPLLLLLLAMLFKVRPSGFVTSLLFSFVVQLSLLAGGIALFHLILKKWKKAVLALVAGLTFYSFFAPFIGDYEKGPSDISIAQFNVLKFNKDYTSTINAAIESDCDLVSFQEVDQQWGKELEEGLSIKYPFSKLYSREDCYGLAIFSKYPLSDIEVLKYRNFPSIKGVVNLNGTCVNFISTHTRSPISRNNFNLRNEQIDHLINEVNEIEGPLVVMGDFNSVPWDQAITNFKSQTFLKDSRKSLTPTYPSFLPIAGIPIDFIFHSPDIKCVGFDSIKHTSSDHYGVMGKYSLKMI